MTLSAPDKPSQTACALRAGKPVCPETFQMIRRRMLLEFCKWDPQVGDVCTLADFPLILSQAEWQKLASFAEALDRETIQMEQRLLERPDLHRRIGLPRRLCRVLRAANHLGLTPSACRVMRFDFHPTRDGWRISEVNSDVPGGYAEASAFTQLMAGANQQAVPAGDPQATYVQALARCAREGNGAVALLAAAGFMEDQQIIAALANRLRREGMTAILAQPKDLRWEKGYASVLTSTGPVRLDAIVRFYQGEWLAQLPARIGWANLFAGGRTPVVNPGSAILTESKRLPLVWKDLGVSAPIWEKLLPETRDPRDAPWSRDDTWLIKTAYCNTGDSVSARDFLPPKTWRKRWLDVKLHPRQWVAQKRFDTVAIRTPTGAMMFPCIGVYTIDGCACGVYGRLSPGPIVRYSAVDAAVLVEENPTERRNAFTLP